MATSIFIAFNVINLILIKLQFFFLFNISVLKMKSEKKKKLFKFSDCLDIN